MVAEIITESIIAKIVETKIGEESQSHFDNVE